MSTATALTIADRWLAATLRADAGVTAVVGDNTFPEQAASPPTTATDIYVVYSFRAGRVITVQNGIRILSSLRYLVQGIARGGTSAGQLATLANAIDAALHRKSGTVTGGSVLSCVNEEPFKMTEAPNGVLWTHFGAFYRLLVQES